MKQELKALLLYFILALICLSISSYGAYIIDNQIGIYSFSITFILVPFLTLCFITKQLFTKKIEDV